MESQFIKNQFIVSPSPPARRRQKIRLLVQCLFLLISQMIFTAFYCEFINHPDRQFTYALQFGTMFIGALILLVSGKGTWKSLLLKSMMLISGEYFLLEYWVG